MFNNVEVATLMFFTPLLTFFRPLPVSVFQFALVALIEFFILTNTAHEYTLLDNDCAIFARIKMVVVFPVA